MVLSRLRLIQQFYITYKEGIDLRSTSASTKYDRSIEFAYTQKGMCRFEEEVYCHEEVSYTVRLVLQMHGIRNRYHGNFTNLLGLGLRINHFPIEAIPILSLSLTQERIYVLTCLHDYSCLQANRDICIELSICPYQASRKLLHSQNYLLIRLHPP